MATTTNKFAPVADTDHTISLLVCIPVYGAPGAKPDQVTAARIMAMIRQSVHSGANGWLIEHDADADEADFTPIASFESIIGKD